ncbi:MAG TPA: hydroxysqualene dehydroxylase HpnE [Rubrivivax sp.]|nr:hydroxysqualene dehydroxylase HpnE [Rubrivivax sp.]
MNPLRVAVVGAGWAGIAAAVHARKAGHEVHVFEMAPQAGGRARTVNVSGHTLDNGQHILIGAYRATLELMGEIGADTSSLLHRMPLALQYPDGQGLRLRAGPPVPAFVRAVLARHGWSLSDRLSLLAISARWAAQRFQCAEHLSVAELCIKLPAVVRAQLVEPLCVAALNTPASQASAQVFLRVLRDALLSGPGSSDLLLPRVPLGALLPQPALAWFEAHAVRLHTTARVSALQRVAAGWQVDEQQPFDAVVLASSAAEAARLCARLAPQWAATAAGMRYEPIVTLYLHCPGARLALPMTALHADARAPAQFAFDLGALGTAADVFAFVISGAGSWVERGLDHTAQATLAQARTAFPPGTWPQAPALLHVAAEKRATFACTPGLQRPPARLAPGLWAAGDYVAGPYPATLEGAVLSGRFAARHLAAPPLEHYRK